MRHSVPLPSSKRPSGHGSHRATTGRPLPAWPVPGSLSGAGDLREGQGIGRGRHPEAPYITAASVCITPPPGGTVASGEAGRAGLRRPCSGGSRAPPSSSRPLPSPHLSPPPCRLPENNNPSAPGKPRLRSRQTMRGEFRWGGPRALRAPAARPPAHSRRPRGR